MKISTRCVYFDTSRDPYGAIVPPIYQTATSQQPTASEFGEYDYTNDPLVHERISFQQNAEGAGLSPFESWLLLRGMKTLALRVGRQNDTALKVATFLELHSALKNSAVKKVYHPSFGNHPGHEIHRNQSEGDGAVVSFTTGDADFSAHLVEATKLFKIAVSFGSVGSTISLPYHMSHASIPPKLKERLAPPADLVRLSVGIEDANDLIEDLDQAFVVAARQCAQGRIKFRNGYAARCEAVFAPQ